MTYDHLLKLDAHVPLRSCGNAQISSAQHVAVCAFTLAALVTLELLDVPDGWQDRLQPLKIKAVQADMLSQKES